MLQPICVFVYIQCNESTFQFVGFVALISKGMLTLPLLDSKQSLQNS